jgi:hypothetical protein
MDEISLKACPPSDRLRFVKAYVLFPAQIYDALAYHVTQANMNRRIRTVSIWSLQMTTSAVLSALRNMVDPVSKGMRAEA